MCQARSPRHIIYSYETIILLARCLDTWVATDLFYSSAYTFRPDVDEDNLSHPARELRRMR